MGPCHFCYFCLSEYAISNALRKDLGAIPASFTRPNIVSFGKVNWLYYMLLLRRSRVCSLPNFY